MNEVVEGRVSTADVSVATENFHASAFWRRFAHWGATRGPSAFVRWAPPWIGLLFAVLLPQARGMVLRNLRRIHGPRDAWVEARDVIGTFAHFASCLAESLGAGRPEALARRLRVRGGERIDRLLAAKQGFVIATAHVGPWDGAAQALANIEGTRVMVVMAYEDDADAERLHDQVRGLASISVLRIGRHPLDALPALEHLSQGGVVAVQLDRVPRGRPGLEVRLFDQPFTVPSGPFLLAGLARVPFLPVFSGRTGYFERRVDIGEPIFPSRRPSPSELTRLAQAAVSQMEKQIAAFPNQWFHFTTDEEESASLARARHSGPPEVGLVDHADALRAGDRR